MKRKGFLVTIAAPSGGGKSSVCNELIRLNLNVRYSISWTTRAIRGNEVNGEHYFFTDIDTFQKKIKEDFFLEYAVVHGNYYGTSKELVDNLLTDGKMVIFDIDVQGVELMKNKDYDIVTIFLLPPDRETLKKRLINRNTDSEEVINLRLQNSLKEIECHKNYDYLVINDDLRETINTVNSILIAEQNRVNRYLEPILEKFIG
jgi:guanylate kinase